MRNQLQPTDVGKLVKHQHYGRDAIHIAVLPVVAETDLLPSQKIHAVWCEDSERYISARHQKATGIVDPFLPEKVEKGQRFWMFLNPGSIRGMRHDWSCPVFSHEEGSALADRAVERSRRYMEKLGKAFGEYGRKESVEGLIEAGHQVKSTGDIFGFGYDLPYKFKSKEGDYADFWKHWEVLTGEEKPSGWLGECTPFACSC